MPALIRCDFGFRGFSSRDETFSSFISTTPKALGSGTSAKAMTGREDYGLHAAAPLVLDRTVEYISFALASFRDSANTRIFGSVPEKRTRAQPSSNWSRHPSTVLKSAERPRSEASSRDSTFARPSVEYATAPRITG